MAGSHNKSSRHLKQMFRCLCGGPRGGHNYALHPVRPSVSLSVCLSVPCPLLTGATLKIGSGLSDGKKIEDMFSGVDRMPACEGRTDIFRVAR